MSQGYNCDLRSSNTPLYRNIQAQSNYLANKMPNVDRNHPNPIESLPIEDLIYLHTYLQKLINQKMASKNIDNNRPCRATQFYDPIAREIPVDWRDFRNSNPNYNNNNIVPGSRGATATRNGKKMDNNDYHNPYEYSAKQNQLGQLNKPIGKINYEMDPSMLNKMGLDSKNSCNRFPDHIRNVDVESSLLQQETTHLPGQREITQKEFNRFELLPFDPQDPNHIVWPDMPRGGHPTRSDRLEY